LLNRLDEIVVFDPLSHEQLRKVARLQMKDVASRLAERGVALAVTDAALDYILAESYDPVSVIVSLRLKSGLLLACIKILILNNDYVLFVFRFMVLDL
jgi:hypothetical protein